MHATKFLLAGLAIHLPIAAHAHTTEAWHAHPHLMDVNLAAALALTGLTATAVALFYAARQIAVRGRK